MGGHTQLVMLCGVLLQSFQFVMGLTPMQTSERIHPWLCFIHLCIHPVSKPCVSACNNFMHCDLTILLLLNIHCLLQRIHTHCNHDVREGTSKQAVCREASTTTRWETQLKLLWE